MERHERLERDLAPIYRQLKDGAVVPPIDPAREARLMAAFDSARSGRTSSRGRSSYWISLGSLAAAAAVLIAVGLYPARTGHRDPRPDGSLAANAPAPSSVGEPLRETPGPFVLVPGAAALPAMESGTLVRMDVPLALLPSYGVTPPAGRTEPITADLIVAQDGLPRAIRLVD